MLQREPWRPDCGPGPGHGHGSGPDRPATTMDTGHASMGSAAQAEPFALSEPEARALLKAAGLPLVPATLATTADAAVAAAAAFAGPVVVKLVADGIVHKTEVAGVRLSLRRSDEVRAAFDDVRRTAESHGAAFRGVLVAPMLAPPTVELLLGVRRDPAFGPVVTLGSGGTLVEVDPDVTHRLLPVGDTAIEAMLGELRLAPLLRGVRGRPGVDRAALTGAVAAMAGLLANHPDVLEAEINPLFATRDGVLGVDARVYRVGASVAE